ncbi:15655_t:CDS:2 [Gigaspora rosea]|nr:15655_t:CDS:2 [Gigaspora rosea]
MKQSRAWVNRIKYIDKALLVMALLHKRYPGVYEIDRCMAEEENEKIRKQKLIIQGLVPASPEKKSRMEKHLKNKAFEALGMKFHERIWTLRCEAVAEEDEEKSQRIEKKQKKNEKEKNEGTIKETKQEKFQKIFNYAKDIIYGWIFSFTRPTWLSAGWPFKEKANFFGQS